MRLPHEPVPLAELEVTPAGQDLFDDILLSILIVERWRLTPIHPDFKQLFNVG